MQNPRLSSRYAKSLVDLALETGQLDDVFQDMQILRQVCLESRDFSRMIKSPIIKADKKNSIFRAIFEGKLHKLTMRFCLLLIEKGREYFLFEITNSFAEQYRVVKNIQQVSITTAVAIDEKLKIELIAKVSKEIPGKTIELNTFVNPDILGGFLLETENTLLDASIMRELRDLKSGFMDNVYIPNIH